MCLLKQIPASRHCQPSRCSIALLLQDSSHECRNLRYSVDAGQSGDDWDWLKLDLAPTLKPFIWETSIGGAKTGEKRPLIIHR